MGNWLWDPGFGWTFASFQPWGWAPYHYGGWLFDASCGGWFYSPPAYYGYGGYPVRRVPPVVHPPRPLYRPTTAVFVRQNGQLGVVPMHPLDKEGKSSLNLEHGVFSVDPARNASVPALPASAGQKWETVKSPQREALNNGLVAASAPVRTSRTLVEGSSGTRPVSLSHNSSIVYDAHEHRFVNNEATTPSARDAEAPGQKNVIAGTRNDHIVEGPRTNQPAGSNPRVPVAPTSARATAPPSRSIAPPPAPRSSSGGGASSAYSGGGGTSRTSSAPSAPASHASAPSSSGGGGGGRPH
jgi:hypothetical protein